MCIRSKYIFRNSKAQSAVEYLMTYGWMLLVVAITGGAIFSMVGEQSIESVQGFNSNEIQVTDFGMTPSSLQMNVKAFGADSATLKQIRLEDSNYNVSVSLNDDIRPGNNKILNLPYIRNSDSSDQIDVELVYDSGKLEGLTTFGTLIGDLELDNSLVGYWSSNENRANETHIFDLSQHESDAEINEPEFVGDEEKGQILEFDGVSDTLVTSAEASRRVPNPDFSIVFSVNPSITSEHDLINWDYGNPIRIELNRGESEAVWYRLRGDETSFIAHSSTSGSVPVNSWTTVVITVDENAGEGKIYIDGKLDSTNTFSPQNINKDSSNLVIGQDLGSPEGNYHGRLNEVRIYNRALSNEEIWGIYKNQGLIQ